MLIADRVEDWLEDVDARVAYAITIGKEKKLLQDGDAIIVVTGWQKGTGFTNTMRVLYVK